MKYISRRNFLPIAGLIPVSLPLLSLTKSKDFETFEKAFPKILTKGDTIGICAPAGCVSEASEVKDFAQALKSMGFNIKIGKNAGSRYGYFSATDQERAAEFMDLIQDTNVSAIFTVRGGWGCARILDYLDFNAIRNNPKIIMGFSDITTLLNAITSKTGLVTFHGPGGNSSWNKRTLKYFEDVIMKGESVTFSNIGKEDQNVLVHAEGRASGELYGGNLSVITSLIGSGYLPDWNGKILFLEDVKEEPYRIDRMLTQLKLAGVFDKVDGIALGVFRDCIAEEPERAFTLNEVFDQHFKGLNKPVLSGLQFGHVKTKFILPVGVNVELSSSSKCIQMLEGAVKK
jgi:muramoyltetrapeptide carboxypeptidase